MARRADTGARRLQPVAADYAKEAAEHALEFIEALLLRDHSVERVFFFHEGVYHGLNSKVPAQTQHATDLRPRWAALRTQNIELAVCIASGIKRGVVDAVEQQRYDLPSSTLVSDFTLVGLGQLIAAIEGADRYIEFPA